MGPPGTGKTFTLAHTVRGMREAGKSVSVTATTGIASNNLVKNGLIAHTIHSFSGILDGRFSLSQLTLRIDNAGDYNLNAVCDRIMNTDCLVIDEISMLSAKVFTQIECVFRHVKKDKKPFGGTQIILFGDFNQLRPIPNDLYSDNGNYCFTANSFKQISFHHIILHCVYRQKEIPLVQAVEQLCVGEVTPETKKLLESLKRDINCQAVELYALNYDVDLANSKHLMPLPGDVKLYHAIDKGSAKDLKKLDKLQAPKTLALKVDSPVVLLQNIATASLVNGQRGTVKEMLDEHVIVHFHGNPTTTKLGRYLFGVYDPCSGKDLSSRLQIPLKLAYAITVHKAQGMTIEPLKIDARHMNQPGQLGVALGRGTHLAAIQLVNYDPNRKLPKHPTEVSHFLFETQARALKDLTCCCNKLMECTDQEENLHDEFVPVDEGVLLTDTEIATIVDTPNIELSPNMVNDDDLSYIISSLQYDQPITAEQVTINDTLRYLLDNVQDAKGFCNFIYSAMEKLKIHQEISNKEATQFYSQFHQTIVTSIHYKSQVFSLLKTNHPNPSQTNAVMKVVSKLRAVYIEKLCLPIVENAKQVANDVRRPYPVGSNSGRGKIRYIGGWAIATLSYRKREQVKRSLFSKKYTSLVSELDNEVRLLDSLTSPSVEVLLSISTDIQSLEETSRRQNLRGSLTNITDPVYNFFLELDKYITALETSENINLHGPYFPKFLIDKLMSNEELRCMWLSLFKLDTLDTCSEEHKDNIMARHLNHTDSLFKEVVVKYTNVAAGELRKRLMEDVKVQKEEAHRKQVKIGDPALKSFTYSFIEDDKTSNKIASHRRLQSEFALNELSLQTFTKAQLVVIAKAYNIRILHKDKKDEICRKLNQSIQKADKMMNPGVFNVDYSSTTSSQIKPVCADSHGDNDYGPSTSTGVGTGDDQVPKKKKRACKWPCGKCAKNCINNCVCCDSCQSWYHFKCLAIDKNKAFEDEWICNTCSV